MHNTLGFLQHAEPESIKAILENYNFNPARKKSFFHQFLMPLSG